MKIYISIPITGREDKAREKADLIKADFSRKGHQVVIPFDVYAGKHPTYTDYLCYDLLAMCGCDAIYFCEGWERSCGCRIEHDVAMKLKAYAKKDFIIMYE